MQTRVSTKGQVVLPSPIRRRLNLQPGDALEATIESGRVILTRTASPVRKARIAHDAITCLPVLKVGVKAPKLTSRQVAELLAEFP